LKATLKSVFMGAALAAAAGAGTRQLDYELNALAGYNGSRAVYAVPEQRPGVGLDYLQVLSGPYGDIARIQAQARLTVDPNGRFEPPYVLTPFGGNDAPEVPAANLEFHNLYGQIKLNQGRSDVWAGRRSIAFGLEPTLDTHSSMLQSFAMHAAGFKADWGGGVQGRFEKWDYRAAATLGSGMPLAAYGNYLGAARLGVLDMDADNIGFGVSALYGRTLPTMELMIMSREPVARMLAGLDASWQRGALALRVEVVGGEAGGVGAGGAWARATVTVPAWRWLAASGQGSWFYDDFRAREEMVHAGVEVTAKYNAALTPGLAYFYERTAAGVSDHSVFVHFYYAYPNLATWRPSR